MPLPRGPAGARFPVSNAYASRRDRGVPRKPREAPLGEGSIGSLVAARGSRSKKGYTGTKAGLGRARRPTPATGPIYRRGPAGPAGARFEAVRLPQRSTTRAANPPAKNKRPGLINRIFRRMRGA
jgi:hypothetical protein